MASQKRQKIECKVDSGIRLSNYPFLTWTYLDHEAKCEYVCVVVSTISGSQDINFVLSKDGTTLVIHYVWPSAMYTPTQLFHNELTRDENAMTVNHPKLHTFVTHLLEKGITEESRPRGTLSITLPKKVRRELDSWTKEEVQSNIFLLQFTACHSVYERFLAPK